MPVNSFLLCPPPPRWQLLPHFRASVVAGRSCRPPLHRLRDREKLGGGFVTWTEPEWISGRRLARKIRDFLDRRRKLRQLVSWNFPPSLTLTNPAGHGTPRRQADKGRWVRTRQGKEIRHVRTHPVLRCDDNSISISISIKPGGWGSTVADECGHDRILG